VDTFSTADLPLLASAAPVVRVGGRGGVPGWVVVMVVMGGGGNGYRYRGTGCIGTGKNHGRTKVRNVSY